jgi:hypothetical protein
MNTLATVVLAITSEDIISPHSRGMVCSPRGLGAGTLCLLSEQEAILRDRDSTKLEDPRTGRWVRSWRTEGLDHESSRRQ